MQLNLNPTVLPAHFSCNTTTATEHISELLSLDTTIPLSDTEIEKLLDTITR